MSQDRLPFHVDPTSPSPKGSGCDSWSTVDAEDPARSPGAGSASPMPRLLASSTESASEAPETEPEMVLSTPARRPAVDSPPGGPPRRRARVMERTSNTSPSNSPVRFFPALDVSGGWPPNTIRRAAATADPSPDSEDTLVLGGHREGDESESSPPGSVEESADAMGDDSSDNEMDYYAADPSFDDATMEASLEGFDDLENWMMADEHDDDVRQMQDLYHGYQSAYFELIDAGLAPRTPWTEFLRRNLDEDAARGSACARRLREFLHNRHENPQGAD